MLTKCFLRNHGIAGIEGGDNRGEASPERPRRVMFVLDRKPVKMVKYLSVFFMPDG